MKSISNLFLKIARFFDPNLLSGFILRESEMSEYQKENKRFWESEFIRSESLHDPRISSIEEGIAYLFARLRIYYNKSNELKNGLIEKEENDSLILRGDNGKPLITISKDFLENHQEGFCDTFMFAHDGYWRKHYTERGLSAQYREENFKQAKELYERAVEFGGSFAKGKLKELENIDKI